MPLKVLFVSAEVAPFKKTGGLGDVVGALPKALRKRGIDVRVVMPLYQGMDWKSFETFDGSLDVPMYYGRARAGVRVATLPGTDVPVYFLEHHRYFDRPQVYGPPGGAYPDNLERFVFLSRGSLELCKRLGWIPDVLNAHDWQAAFAPVYLNTVEWGQPLHGTASVLTIHNLAYQGATDPGAMFITGLGGEHFNPGEFEHFGSLNPLKAALAHSTFLCTVSPSYAAEIRTPEFGCGLDGVLRGRAPDLRGILNGVDVDEWNPATDRHLPKTFTAASLSGKAACKAALQKELGLPVRPDLPLFGVVGRLTAQKGLDVLAHAMPKLLQWDMQLVLLGTGDPEAERFFASMSRIHGDKFHAHIGFSDALSHRVEAGADFFIMPSRFEPCGLNQMYSLRYGTLPIVRATGGLVDTVENLDEATGTGTGFVFKDLGVGPLTDTIGWALSTYHDRPLVYRAAQQRAMSQDHSWDRAAGAYERLFFEAYARRRGHPFVG